MKDYSRLIEHAFPLRQASIDSLHEKMCHQGHIKGIHIWPARRPLAAARAALLATLLPDPGTPQGRKELCEKIGGRLTTEIDKEGRVKEVTDGGVLRWKREVENKATLDWFRDEIRIANGGVSPKILDPFSGGGAIPFEAMRLGCEATAMDINPVAWFILKCTMEYPQKLAGQKRTLPDFIRRNMVFMEEFFSEVHGLKGARLRKAMEALGHNRKGVMVQEESDFGNDIGVSLEADLPWHVRAWGRKVLGGAREELANLYPTYAEWQPLTAGKSFEPQPMRLIAVDEHGVANVDKLNTEVGEAYLQDKTNPRWIAKLTVAYLWARTANCKNCRSAIPLLTSSWLYKKGGRRIRLVMNAKPDRTGVDFTIEHNVPERGGNAAQKREHDKKAGAGTMSKAGAQCPCCSTAATPIIMTKEDLRYESRNGRLGQIITAVVVDGPHGKEYRLPTDHERRAAEVGETEVSSVFAKLPFGVPDEPTPKCGPGASRAFSLDQYGFDQWSQIFFRRQLLTIGTLACGIRRVRSELASAYPQGWVEAIAAYLACSLDKVADYNSALVPWQTKSGKGSNTFNRWALPMKWDVVENAILDSDSGGFLAVLDWVSCPLTDTLFPAAGGKPAPVVVRGSSISAVKGEYDAIITDPPYYDAIPYSDLMDFFLVWLRRTVGDLSPEYAEVFRDSLGPKWDDSVADGELIDDASRHNKDKARSKQVYEDGMAKVFLACHAHLKQTGRFVVVFANKQPDAWETLVSAIIRAGFVVAGSWPIATEMANRTRAMASAALASSVWLVCRKRDPMAKVGWDSRVIAEMRENIAGQLREFWDAGIRGPDFVWAATGPAMEAYSKYPAVKKANSPTNEFLSVKEFLDAVRRIVIEFVVGRVLHIEAGTDRLDSVTSYYLLHRNDFGFEKAPAGACIMYAVSCGLSDAELERTWNLVKVKGSVVPEVEEGDAEVTDEDSEAPEEASGGEFILRTWKERQEKRMGFESVGGREIPLIDRVHRLMHLWRNGDVRKVDDYLDEYALRQNELFGRLIQSLIELSEQASEERALLESLSNHLGGKAAKADTTRSLGLDVET
jgi:putative DNA methylase